MLFSFMFGEIGEAQPLLISFVPKASFSNSILIFPSSSFSDYSPHGFDKISSVSIDMSSFIIFAEFSLIFMKYPPLIHSAYFEEFLCPVVLFAAKY